MDKDFFQHVYKAMYSVALCDGKICDTEAGLLNDFHESHNLSNINTTANELVESPDMAKTRVLIESAADLCDTDRKKYFLLNRISQIADADGRHHTNEALALEVLYEKWNLNLALSTPLVNWTDSQRAVIESGPDERILVDAPPGAGKTAIIAARIDYLINELHVNSYNIWLISFTRTAVREMRDRINLLKTDYPHGLRISTLDSAVFSMNFSLQAYKEVNFDSYEMNIEAFSSLLQEGDDDLLDFLDGMDHIIIDEAQDFVGVRKKLCVELISKLPNQCGVTVLGDEFQQIYGRWSTGSNDVDVSSLQQAIGDTLNGEKFRQVELSEIHRTDSPVLLSLIEDLRIDLAVYDKSSKVDLDRRKEILRDRIDSISREDMLASASSNCLVLYRHTTDVIAATTRLNQLGRPFRLRLPAYARYMSPWINALFEYAYKSGSEFMGEEEFEQFKSTLLTRDKGVIKFKPAWQYLREIARERDGISIDGIREILGKYGSKAVEFQNPEFGCIGPIISTVHSSKGRQAEQVYFDIPEAVRSRSPDYGEESRVLFVGASRAQNALKILDEKRDVLAKGWERYNYPYPRYFKLFKSPNPKYRKWPAGFSQIGIDGDYDNYSIVSSSISLKKVDEAQEFLKTYWPLASSGKCYATRENLAFKVLYLIEDKEIFLGYLSDQVSTSLTYGSRKIFHYKFNLPVKLKLSIVDVATHISTKDDPNLKSCLKKYSDRGTWLYPVLFGIGPYFYTR